MASPSRWLAQAPLLSARLEMPPSWVAMMRKFPGETSCQASACWSECWLGKSCQLEPSQRQTLMPAKYTTLGFVGWTSKSWLYHGKEPASGETKSEICVQVGV